MNKVNFVNPIIKIETDLIFLSNSPTHVQNDHTFIKIVAAYKHEVTNGHLIHFVLFINF